MTDEIARAIERLGRDAVTHYQGRQNGFAANSISEELIALMKAANEMDQCVCGAWLDLGGAHFEAGETINYKGEAHKGCELLALARKINGDSP